MLKKLNMILFSFVLALGFVSYSFAQDEFDDFSIEDEVVVQESEINEDDIDAADAVSAEALMNYEVAGSLFEKITTLEQEKVVIQLQKERAQLDLELERLNAERIKLQMELDTLSGRAEQQQQELETAKAKLEYESEQLKRQMETLDNEEEMDAEVAAPKQQVKKETGPMDKKYKLINLVGVGNQLQATIEDVSTGQNRRIEVGKELDGYIVKSISLVDGIVFEKDGETSNIGVGK